MTDLDNWLHQYRQLYRDDPVKFSTESQNFTDSRLKFKRNFLFILKKKYLLCEGEQDVKNAEEVMEIVQHLISTNKNRKWNIMENMGFIQIVAYIYMHLMKDITGMHDFLNDLYILNPRNTQFREKVMFLATVLSVILQGQEQKAFELLQKMIEMPHQLELINNPKTYMVMYHLVQLIMERKRIAKVAITPEEDQKFQEQLLSYAKKSHEKNSQRDPRFTEQLVYRLIKTGTCEQLIQLLERSKFGIYDFTFTVPELITKLKTSTVKTPLLKKRNLQILFERQPYCVTTFKALGAEINRKAKQKPQNKLKILNCLIKFLEHAENGGDTEQWMFLSACIKQAMEREPGQFSFQEHLKTLGAYEAWSTVILGSNIVKLLQQMLRDKNNGMDPDNQKITSIMQVMEISGINSTKLPGIQKFIEQQFPQ